MANGWYVRSLLFLAPTHYHEALERATYSSKSFLIGLALVLGKITTEEAALASTIEVSSQIQRWGEVEDCGSVVYECPDITHVYS